MKINWRIYDKSQVDHLRSLVVRQEREIRQAEQLAKIVESESWDSLNQIEVDEQTPLSQALQSLKRNLILVNKKETEKAWVSKNVTELGILLQKYQTSLKSLTDEVLKQVVKRSNANQGACFVHSNENGIEFLELMSMYAYDRKKYLEKRVAVGSDLHGQCFLDGGVTILTDVPTDYIKITSGLGEATPRCIVLIALEVNEKKMGVMELAFFHKPYPHQIEFFKIISESFARAIYWVKESDRTKHLLKRSEELSQDLKSQEEELRQNIEEMQAIQDEVTRRNIELENSRNEIEQKNLEIENMNALIESKMETQKTLYEAQLDRLRKKIMDLQAKPISIEHVNKLMINKN